MANNAGVSSRIQGFAKMPDYEIRIASKNLVEILIDKYEIPSGAKSLNVTVPRVIMAGNKLNKKSFLRGVIDGDGSILSNSIKIASGSAKFLVDIKELLLQLQISAGKIIKDNKKTNTYAIRIWRKADLVKIKSIYNSKFAYKRKKTSMDKI